MSSSEETSDEVLEDLLLEARHNSLNGFYTIGLEKYMQYFQKTPKQFWTGNSEHEFVDLLCDLEVCFNDTSTLTELVKCFQYAVAWFPNNSKLHNGFGSVLIKRGDQVEGIHFILKAYKLAKENKKPCLAIEKNLLHVLWTQIPRWHFRMLNGKVRNTAYKKAINKALDKGYKNVLDIGSGCGLLSLYAGTHRSHPSVVAYETNTTLYEKGVALMSKYCKESNYSCYGTCSYLVTQIMEQPRDLLVTEIFDVAVFGEGILKSLRHAFNILMQQKEFCVIPAEVVLYVTGIKCKKFDKKYRLHNTIPIIQIENVCVTKLVDNDPYDAEMLLQEKVDFLTDTKEFMKLNFSDKDFIDCLLQERWNSKINLLGKMKGTIDSLVVWFELHLDSETIISTNPYLSENEPCWEQAIFHLKHPVQVNSGEQVTFHVTVENEHLNFELINPLRCNSLECFSLSEDAIRFLNDEKWVECLISLSHTFPENLNSRVLDFCVFPLVGLILAKKGYEVFHFFKEKKNLIFIEHIMAKNDIDSSLLCFVEYDKYPHCILSLGKIDYAIFEPVQQDGSLKASPMDNVVFQNLKVKSAFEDILVHFSIIHSPYLDYCNRVDKENVQPFEEMVKEMNEFSGSEHPSLPHDFPHEKMTNEQTWNAVKQPYTIEVARALKSGKINGIMIWYTIVGNSGIQFCTKSSWNFSKNVLIFPEREVEAEELFKLLCRYEGGGLLKIEICEEMWLRTNFEKFCNNSSFDEYIKNNFIE